MAVKEIFKKLIDENGGHTLLAEEKKDKLKGLISDYFPHDSKKRKMLHLAVDENIGCRLLNVKDSKYAHVEIEKLKLFLHKECARDEEIATKVVECFAFALGLDSVGSNSKTSKSEIEPKKDKTIRKDTTSEQANEKSASVTSPSNGRQTAHHLAEPEMVLVKGGTFMMGATPEQSNDCNDNEKPAHRVTVSDFYIGKYEITQDQWEAVMGNNPSHFQGENLPVEQVSWDDVQVFISKLNKLTGKLYRLPTEAEWELAARGGKKSSGNFLNTLFRSARSQKIAFKYSGSNILSDVAWNKDNSGNKTQTVGTKSPNELGIYDMSGNIWEWCSDIYGGYSSNDQTNPQGPNSGPERVIRGGSWRNDASFLRVSYRESFSPNISNDNLGFRLAQSSK